MREALKKCERIVIKAGTSILTGKSGLISGKNLERLGLDLLQLMKQKKQIVLVSSGAIAFGMEATGRQDRPKEMPELQACAAIGQGRMMHAYEKFFSKKRILTSQILLTQALREGDASFVLPFDYSQLVFSALFGLLVYAEVPAVYTVVGSAVIAGAAVLSIVEGALRGRKR